MASVSHSHVLLLDLEGEQRDAEEGGHHAHAGQGAWGVGDGRTKGRRRCGWGVMGCDEFG